MQQKNLKKKNDFKKRKKNHRRNKTFSITSLLGFEIKNDIKHF
jgi:hypothetical protein